MNGNGVAERLAAPVSSRLGMYQEPALRLTLTQHPRFRGIRWQRATSEWQRNYLRR